VLNRAPRSARSRAALTSSLAELVSPLARAAGSGIDVAGPIFLPERRIEEALRDGVRLPSALTAPLAGAFRAVTERARPGSADDAAEPVRPGSLGHWAGPVEAAGS
jgi:hypothetical protein